MSLDTYTGLQAAVAAWLARADMTSIIPDLITLAEAKFNRTLRCRQMEQRATATATEYVEMPTGFLELRNIQLNTTPKTPLRLISPEEGDTFYTATSGKPLYYAILANQFQMMPAPDGTYTVEIDYYEVIPPLASNSTNWLLTLYPDLYLYGALLEASPYLQDDARVSLWAQGFQAVMDGVQRADRRARWSGSTPRVRAM